jgi:hypothetical protein
MIKGISIASRSNEERQKNREDTRISIITVPNRGSDCDGYRMKKSLNLLAHLSDTSKEINVPKPKRFTIPSRKI